MSAAQERGGKCIASAEQIYYVDSGQMVTEVHPGPNGGNGYQLNILGTGANNFEVVKERYMTSLSVIPNYTNETAAKWSVYFAPKMAQRLTGIQLRNKCTGETRPYRLIQKTRSWMTSVFLFD